MRFEKVTLRGQHVRLESLEAKHRLGLAQAVSDGELWTLFFTFVPHTSEIDGFLAKADDDHASGDGLAFAIIDVVTDRVIGSTRFMRASLPHRRVEIGFTFVAKSYQRTPMNTEAKLLLLTYAFETLGLNRVEFLTDYLNITSKNAILRIGAKQEGILRSHRVMPDGRIRDSVLFSILNHEWQGVKQSLEFKLSR